MSDQVEMEVLRREIGTLRAERDGATAAMVRLKVTTTELLLEERARRISAEQELARLRAALEKKD